MSTSMNFPSNTMTNPGNPARNNNGSSSESNRPTSTFTPELHNFLRTRRSIRRFKPHPVPDSVLQTIITTAIFAPSSHNRQLWRLAVITDLSVKAKLAEAMSIDFPRDLAHDGLSPEKIQ